MPCSQAGVPDRRCPAQGPGGEATRPRLGARSRLTPLMPPSPRGRPRRGECPGVGKAPAQGWPAPGAEPRLAQRRAPVCTSGPEAKAKATLPAVRRRTGLALTTLLLPLSLETDDAPPVPHRDWARSTGGYKKQRARGPPTPPRKRSGGLGCHGAATPGADRAGRPGAGGR